MKLSYVLRCAPLIAAALGLNLPQSNAADFSYRDTDLLMVFRKNGFNDVEFNLGSISNYLGQANGSMLSVSNWDFNRVLANFGSDLSGVKYVLMAVASSEDPILRVWLSDSAPSDVPHDETFSKWSTQRGKINAVGVRASAYSYPAATNQSLTLSSSSPDSYTYIASDGGSLDVTTMGGAAPFPVEQDIGANVRLFELKVSSASPKPFAVDVGTFALGTNGALSFTAGVAAPLITTGPSNQTVECGANAQFTVTASGEEPLSYQWYFGVSSIGGATASTLTLNNVSSTNGGSYTVVVSNAGGSVTSAPAVLTVVDTTGPVLSLPANITVTATSASGAIVTYSATATDACVGSVPIVCVPVSGSTFPIGATLVNCVADDGQSHTNSGSFSVTVQRGFTYQDTDLLMVFRKSGFNDVEFNLGNISNYLGQANGSMLSVSNWDFNRVLANFGSDLSGVKYVLMAVASSEDPLLRVWLSDSAPSDVPHDETFSRWSTQRGKINAVGVRASAYSYPAATNQSLTLSSSSPDSYTYIASDGGSLDVTTMGGAAPFPVEQDIGANVRLFELKVSSANPKPFALEVGRFELSTNGNLKFTAETNRSPLASDDGAATETNRPVTISFAQLLANDSDPDGNPLIVISVSATSTNGGAVTLGASDVTYTPLPGFIGLDRFSYTISDEHGGTAAAQVEILVTDRPVPSQNALAIRNSANGFLIRFVGLAGRSYELQRATVVTGSWTTLTMITAPLNGLIEFEDTNPPPDRAFYRAVDQ